MQHAFRGRYKHCTQNVLAAVDFDQKFTYVLAGWEGTAHDALVFYLFGQCNLCCILFDWTMSSLYLMAEIVFEDIFVCYLAEIIICYLAEIIVCYLTEIIVS